jgi:hypothetical protein
MIPAYRRQTRLVPARRSAKRFACLREAASAKAGYTGGDRNSEINFIDNFKFLY